MRASSSGTGITIVETLAVTITVLALIAALAGVFWPGGEGSYTITTYRGQEVVIFGQGVYRDSSVFGGAGARGTDAVTLLIGIPLLVSGLVMHRRGPVGGTLVLAGGLIWMLYVYASVALGAVAYNDLFLLYVAIFAASLWAFVLLIAGVDSRAFGTSLMGGVSRNLLGGFLIASGAITIGIWLIEPVSGLVTGAYPELLGVSTTLFTHAYDMAVIAPAAIITGVMVRRGHPLGVVLAIPMLILEAMLAPAIIAQTLFQMSAEVEFSLAQMVIMIGGFVALAVVAIWMLAGIFRHLGRHAVTASSRPARAITLS